MCMSHGDAVRGSWGCSAWIMGVQCMDHGGAVHGSWGCSAWIMGVQCIAHEEYMAHGDAVHGSWGCSAWGMVSSPMGLKVLTIITAENK